MPLHPRTALGPYEVPSPIGAGGVGFALATMLLAAVLIPQTAEADTNWHIEGGVVVAPSGRRSDINWHIKDGVIAAQSDTVVQPTSNGMSWPFRAALGVNMTLHGMDLTPKQALAEIDVRA